jgi:hypothetical protein
MPGAGIEVRYHRAEFQKILDALSKPYRAALSRFMGEELRVVDDFQNYNGPC